MANFKKASLPENLSLNVDDQKKFHQKVKELEKDAPHKGGSGVVFIKHIPHGFFEPQMRAYFSQFGKIKRMRVSRSKKTGHIKGYGYIEFAEDAVAKIVASTMNNYLMFHRLIKCSYVPESEVHEDTFKGCDRKFSKPKAHAISRQRHNTTKTPEQMAKAEQRARTKQKKSLAKLAEMGIEYELPGMMTKEEIRAVVAEPSAEDTKPEALKTTNRVVKAGKRGKALAEDKPAPGKKRKVVQEEIEEEEEKEESESDSVEYYSSDVENEEDSEGSDSDFDADEFDFDAMFGTSEEATKSNTKQKDTGSKNKEPVKKDNAKAVTPKVATKDSKKPSPKSQPSSQGGKRGARGGKRR